jgi:hypothetical protein
MGRGQKKKDPVLPEHCQNIKQYESSKFWHTYSSNLLDNKECVCHICGRRRWKWLPRKQQWKRVLRFSCHHVTYKHVGHELPEDIVTLCSLCHTTAHKLVRYRGISSMYNKLAEVVDIYFQYEGANTFVPW